METTGGRRDGTQRVKGGRVGRLARIREAQQLLDWRLGVGEVAPGLRNGRTRWRAMTGLITC